MSRSNKTIKDTESKSICILAYTKTADYNCAPPIIECNIPKITGRSKFMYKEVKSFTFREFYIIFNIAKPLKSPDKKCKLINLYFDIIYMGVGTAGNGRPYKDHKSKGEKLYDNKNPNIAVIKVVEEICFDYDIYNLEYELIKYAYDIYCKFPSCVCKLLNTDHFNNHRNTNYVLDLFIDSTTGLLK